MDLLEYQAKELFREIGIPVLPSCRIDHPRDLKRLQIPYPVVLKSQVPTGGRGKAGGIRFVENTIDAIAAARAIFSLPILGKYPQVLLAEARYDAEMELYLAVILDYSLARPVLLGSTQGGANIEEMISQIQRVVVEQEFSPFYARRLAMKMGLQGNLMESVSGIIEKMYQLFVQKDLDLVEINPLGISSQGELMALDGKISVNDSALGRHAELVSLTSTIASGDTYSPILDRPLTELNWIDTEGNMGIVCNSSCLAATTLDLIYEAKGKPASCLIVDGYASWDATASFSPVKQLQSALQQITETKGIKVVLLNILSSAAATEEVAQVLTKHLLSQLEEAPIPSPSYAFESQNGTASSFRKESHNGTRILPRRKTLTTSLPHFVIRMISEGIESTKERLAGLPVHWIDDLDQAVAKAISLAQSAAK
jgi:succinyl-CoA synthetase beta subunit